MYSVADLRVGHAIEIDGVPYLVLSAKFGKKSRGKANCATKIRNLKTGAITQRTFSGNEETKEAVVGYRHVQFLYSSSDAWSFMDLNTYDQFELSGDVVGEAEQYLVDGMELDVLVFEEKPIAIKLPVTVDLKVTETAPGLRGDTAQGGTKPATLQSGLVVQVPLFINEGEVVKVNTESGEYIERA